MSERLLPVASALHFQTTGLLLPQLSACLQKHGVVANNINVNQFFLLVISHLFISTIVPLLKEQYET